MVESKKRHPMKEQELLKNVACKRRAVIVIENDAIGDGYWFPLVAESLREYAALIETQIAFRGDVDEYESQNGDRITCMGGSLIYEPFTKKDVDGITDEDRAWARERRDEKK